VNLAAQYASRIIILKDGRKWWDGTPAEVLTPQHMYTAFGIHAQAYTDQRSLKTIIVPQEIRLDAGEFNSNLSVKHQTPYTNYKTSSTDQDETLNLLSVQA
jgi:iron complex transport system ATP-binding protein